MPENWYLAQNIDKSWKQESSLKNPVNIDQESN
jgi:hypothetical protein